MGTVSSALIMNVTVAYDLLSRQDLSPAELFIMNVTVAYDCE